MFRASRTPLQFFGSIGQGGDILRAFSFTGPPLPLLATHKARVRVKKQGVIRYHKSPHWAYLVGLLCAYQREEIKPPTVVTEVQSYSVGLGRDSKAGLFSVYLDSLPGGKWSEAQKIPPLLS